MEIKQVEPAKAAPEVSVSLKLDAETHRMVKTYAALKKATVAGVVAEVVRAVDWNAKVRELLV